MTRRGEHVIRALRATVRRKDARIRKLLDENKRLRADLDKVINTLAPPLPTLEDDDDEATT